MINDHRVFKEVITASVEKALLEMGVPQLNLVRSRLKEDYNCEISDCLDHPEYLKLIIHDLFGNSHEHVLKSIHKSIKKTGMEQPLENFLTILESSN